MAVEVAHGGGSSSWREEERGLLGGETIKIKTHTYYVAMLKHGIRM